MRKLEPDQKERLDRLFKWGKISTGKGRSELARALGRDPARPVPDFAPPLGYVRRLADVLELPLGVVAQFIYCEDRGLSEEPDDDEPSIADVSSTDFDALEQAAKSAHLAGRHEEMIGLARLARTVAETPEQRARASNLEAGGYDGLGRYVEALDATQRGLAEPSIPGELRHLLLGNLASAYYTLWRVYEARAMAGQLIEHFDHAPAATLKDRVASAHARYVRGHALRRLLQIDPEGGARHAEAARVDLEEAARLYDALAAERDVPAYGGIANTCRGGLVEIDAALGERDPRAAVDALLEGIDEVVDVEGHPGGDWLESYGWWCIFGCNVMRRHLADARDFGITIAQFTDKANEIANRTNNWSLRERVLTMNYARHVYVNANVGPADWTIDSDDVREILGTIGRFPRFRATGWKILQSAIEVSHN